VIESRGNVQVDMDTGNVRFLRTINFVPKTTNDEPKAELISPETAIAICRDIAEVQQLFHCPLDVQGHTKGGEGPFWQTLANERARIIVEQIATNNVNRSMIKASGLPGKLGMNETRTVVHVFLHGDQQAVDHFGHMSTRSASSVRTSLALPISPGGTSNRMAGIVRDSINNGRLSLSTVTSPRSLLTESTQGTQSVPAASFRYPAATSQPVRPVHGVQSRSLESLASVTTPTRLHSPSFPP